MGTADYLGASREYGETPFIELDTYRALMGIKEGGYPQFKEFNRCAVKEPVAEINSISDFQVNVDYLRQGRKVTALKFKMRRVALLPEPNKEQGKLFPELDDMPLVVRELKEAGIASPDAWEIWQQGFGYVDEKARPAEPAEDADAAFVQYIREKVHLLKRRQAPARSITAQVFCSRRSARTTPILNSRTRCGARHQRQRSRRSVNARNR